MGQYIPMIGKTFWEKLSADQQKMMIDLWAQNIGDYRKNAAASQDNARKVMEANNVKFHDPSPEEAGATRKAMMADINSLIKDAKLSPEVVDLVKASVGSA
jgi:C4-dicarboxylate-binding protein DctP